MQITKPITGIIAAFLNMNINPLRSALLRLIGGIVEVLIFMPLRSNHGLA